MRPGWYIKGMWWSKYKCIKSILITLIMEVICPFKQTPPIRLTLNTTFTFSFPLRLTCYLLLSPLPQFQDESRTFSTD